MPFLISAAVKRAGDCYTMLFEIKYDCRFGIHTVSSGGTLESGCAENGETGNESIELLL